ncbi:MAG: energy transducer TonB [Sphingomonas sp. 28-66-16]|nr:MAG: energy transducer TonB [Sphingomonas sp. 28-66-16]
MAYADRNDGGNKVVAIVIVALIHAALGYAFVTGLAYQYVKKVSEKLNTFDVAPPPPPPPDEPPPPPPDQPLTPPPVVSPPPIVRNPNPPVVQIQTQATPPPVYTPIPTAPPAPPPAPPPPRVNQAAGAKGNPADWITTDDYPPSALREEKEGTTSITWTINTQGRVENCRVTGSSGSSDLDEAACRAITRRGRYTPAKDQDGNPIATSQSRRVVWKIPK